MTGLEGNMRGLTCHLVLVFGFLFGGSGSVKTRLGVVIFSGTA